MVFAAFAIAIVAVHARKGIDMGSVDHLIFATRPKGHIVVTARRRDPHEGLCHKAGNQIHFACNLGANLTVSRQAVCIAQTIIVHPVQFKLTGGILVIALDHVQTHRSRILNNFHKGRTQTFKLIDMVTVGLREPAVGFPVFTFFQPHHFGFSTQAHVHAVFFFELLMVNAQVATTI